MAQITESQEILGNDGAYLIVQYDDTEPSVPAAPAPELSARTEPPNAKPPSVVPEPAKLIRTRFENAASPL